MTSAAFAVTVETAPAMAPLPRMPFEMPLDMASPAFAPDAVDLDTFDISPSTACDSPTIFGTTLSVDVPITANARHPSSCKGDHSPPSIVLLTSADLAAATLRAATSAGRVTRYGSVETPRSA